MIDWISKKITSGTVKKPADLEYIFRETSADAVLLRLEGRFDGTDATGGMSNLLALVRKHPALFVLAVHGNISGPWTALAASADLLYMTSGSTASFVVDDEDLASALGRLTVERAGRIRAMELLVSGEADSTVLGKYGFLSGIISVGEFEEGDIFFQHKFDKVVPAAVRAMKRLQGDQDHNDNGQAFAAERIHFKDIFDNHGAESVAEYLEHSVKRRRKEKP